MMPRHLPVVFVAVVGIGGLVAVTVAIALYLGLSSATENTRRLLGTQVDEFLDSVEFRIDARLQPVIAQSKWIAARVADASISVPQNASPLEREHLDDFMLGALSGTPQVAGAAIVMRDGASRRWGRDPLEIVQEDWSDRLPVMRWIEVALASRTEHAWYPPFWTPTLDAYVLLHGAPLRRDGAFVGMLGQIVRISDLSAELIDLTGDTALVPFVLVGRKQVLAHPSLASDAPIDAAVDAPLLDMANLGDPVLEQIWSDEGESMFMLSRTSRTEARRLEIDGREFAFLFREIDRYGDRPWTIGAYLDLSASEDEVVNRLQFAFSAGLVVLCVSVLSAVLLAHKLSRPVQDIASVARAISEGRLDQAQTLPSSRLREIDNASTALNAMVHELAERDTIRATLGRYVPVQVARALLRGGGTLDVETGEASVLFCDIEAFTSLTERLGAQGTVNLLNEFFEAMVGILEQHGGVVTQFQGDAILATFNLPVRNAAHARDAVNAAIEMLQCVAQRDFAGCRLNIRIGVNTGQVVAGAVGARGRLSYTVHGDAVNLASRLESLNKKFGSRLLVAAATAEAAGPGQGLVPLGEAVARGQRSPVALYTIDASMIAESAETAGAGRAQAS